MLLYTPDLVTLEVVKRHRKLTAAQSSDDAMLIDMIHRASATFQSSIRRVGVPYYGVHTFDAMSLYCRQYTLDVGKAGFDLLEIETLTNGDGATISGAGVALRTANMYPKWRVELKPSAGVTFTYNGDWQEAISLTGWWGYVPNYPTCWQDTGADVPAGDLSSSATTMTFASEPVAALIETLAYLKIDDEVLQATARSGAVVTLKRAQLGTTAAAHTAGTAISAFQIEQDIADAVREMVVYAYKAKDRVGGSVKVYEGGIVTIDDMDKLVAEAIQRHERKTMVVIR